jgi:tetratricopeptide (TPR) repeat protein
MTVRPVVRESRAPVEMPPTAVAAARPEIQSPERSLDGVLRPAWFVPQKYLRVRPSRLDFVGREGVLIRLEQLFSLPLTPLVARYIVGQAGFGKSELVIWFANQYKDRFSLIWLFHCASESLFAQEIKELGQALGLPLKKQTLEQIYAHLKQHFQEKPFLLIFEDVEQAPPLPTGGGLCLLTTCNSNLATSSQDPFTLPDFSSEEIELLRKQVCRKFLVAKQTTALKDVLYGSPLRLNWALREWHSTTSLWDSYLQEAHSILTLIKTRLSQKDPLAYRFFQLCAYLSPDRISLSLLEDWLRQQNIEEWVRVGRGVVASLGDFSLMEYDPTSQTLSMHTLVQGSFPPLKEIFAQALKLTAQCAAKFNKDQPNSWEYGKEGAIQLSVLRKNLLWQKSLWEVKVELLTQVGLYFLHVQEEAALAEILFKESINLCIEHTPRSSLHARCSAFMGYTLDKLGHYEEALLHHQQALEIRTQFFGNNHSTVAASCNDTGILLDKLGHYEEALLMYERSRGILVQIHGENHSAVATSYNNIGRTLDKLGRNQEALPNHQSALRIRRAVYGEKHIVVAKSHFNLGNTFQALGCYEEALEHHHTALFVRGQIYQDDSSNLAISHYSMGVVLEHLHRFQEALEHHQVALDIRIKKHGSHHPDVAIIHNAMGTTLQALGRMDEALKHLEEARRIWIKAYGESHLDVAASCNNIGITLGSLGRYEEALQQHSQAFEIRCKLCKENHPDLAASNNNIGTTLYSLKRYEEALTHFQHAKAIWVKVHGDNHPDVAKGEDNIGAVLDELGRHEEALESKQCALKIRVAFYKNHPLIASSHNNIGVSLQKLGRKEEALESFQKALDMTWKCEQDPNSALLKKRQAAVQSIRHSG